MDEQQLVQQVTRAVLAALRASEGGGLVAVRKNGMIMVPVGVSVRHVHLKEQDVEVLFGPGHGLTCPDELYQPGNYACNERVMLIGPRGCIRNVRILLPFRSKTQVEVAATDAITLGIRPPVLRSVNEGPGERIILAGPKGYLDVPEAAIINPRHIHMSAGMARELGLTELDTVRCRVPGLRGGIMENVSLRIHPEYRLEMHIDTDEGNAFGLSCGDEVELMVN